ncbi:MAG: hypothetical protein IBX64_10470 [Actinobacteria bacterium]|nr:hypothetical protein [Actinomycetota bacterium]
MMNPSIDIKLLRHAAKRASQRPEYLGWVLARYLSIENISRHDLARRFNIEDSELLRLELCLKPRGESFAEDVEQIASKFGIDAGVLANMIRLVESTAVMTDLKKEEVEVDTGLLMAARARKKNRHSKHTEGNGKHTEGNGKHTEGNGNDDQSK